MDFSIYCPEQYCGLFDCSWRERRTVRKNNKRHPLYIAFFCVSGCQPVFSDENRFVFDGDKSDVQGVVDYEYNAYVLLHHPHIPEKECDVPTHRQALNGTSASYWKNLWWLLLKLNINTVNHVSGLWSDILEMQHWQSMSIRCALSVCFAVYYAKSIQCLIAHMGVWSDKPNYLSHAITSVAELQCRKSGSISLRRTGTQNGAKTWWLIILIFGRRRAVILLSEL